MYAQSWMIDEAKLKRACLCVMLFSKPKNILIIFSLSLLSGKDSKVPLKILLLLKP